jgi:hypothetical protein
MIKSIDPIFNRILYVSFVLLACYYSLFSKQFGEAAMNLGIALAFDPFDQNQTWKERPFWQKAWLILHLAIAASLIGYQIGFDDKS